MTSRQLLMLMHTSQAIAFLDASDTPRPVTIRVNTLKTRRRELAQALINRCVARVGHGSDFQGTKLT